jgi:hypothetical protein
MGTEGKGLQKELSKGLYEGCRPAINGIKAATSRLPQSGGSDVRRLKVVNHVEVGGTVYKVRRRAGMFKPNQSLADKVKKASYVVRLVRGEENAVEIVGRAKGGQVLDLESINNGKVRHPTFGHKGPNEWVDQSVPAGFFTDPCNRNKDNVFRGLEDAAERVAQMLEDI